MADYLIPLIIAVPLLGGAAALFAKLMPSGGKILSVLAVVTILAPAGMLAVLAPSVFDGRVLRYFLGGWPEPYGIALVLDGFSWVSVLLISVIAFLVGLFSLGDRSYSAGYYFFLSLLSAGLFGVALTGDLFTMFVSFEIVAIAAYVLIAYEKTSAGLVASFKYLILSSVGILFFLFGVFLIYRELGTLSLARASQALKETTGVRNLTSIHVALASLCVGIGVRTAFIPFHTWLPEAHAFAPHPVSALLSGVLIKVSFFAMVRILLQLGGGYFFGLLLWIGAFTALLAVLYALAQSDAKRLLAYHSVSQMGYILAVFGAGSSIAVTAAFAHAVNHALFKSLLFLTVGTAIHLNGERNIFRMRALGREAPLFAAAFYVASASIAGIPPFNGYVSKALISSGMKGSPAYYLLWITGFLTIASFIKLGRIYSPASGGASSHTERHRPPAVQAVSVTVLALLCLGLGIFGGPATAVLHGLVSEGGQAQLPRFFGTGKLVSVLPTVLLGTGAFFLVLTRAGKAVSARIRTLTPNLHQVLIFFFAGLLGFVLTAL